MGSRSTEDEKHSQLQESVRSPGSPHDDAELDGDLDEAYQFLALQSDDTAGVDMRKLRRKIDWHIVPIMFLVYLFNLIDKVSLNYAAVMGLPIDLRLDGNDFSNTATAFFAAYLIAELPTGYVLNKVPAGKWLGANVVLWGIATACTAAAKDFPTLLVARIFLGIFEAPVAPCLMLISSQWYTKPEQAPRFSFWYCGLGFGQILGGIVSFAFQHVQGASLAGWRIMFVVLGCVTVILGFVTFYMIPDAPMTARFLSDAEKTTLLQHVSANQTGVRSRRFKASHLLEAATDVQLWLLTLMTILPSISSGVVSTYSATLIAGFGYSPPIAALLNTPAGLVSIFSTLLVGYGIQRTSHRWAWFVACCVPGIVGGGLMSFLPASNQGGLLTGIYLINFVVPTVIINYQYAAANVAGHTKRAFGTSLMAFAFGVGNIIGPQTFQASDAPEYIPAKITVLATQGAAAIVAVVLFAYYKSSNSRRDRKFASTNDSEDLERPKWSNVTDKENKAFRYIY